MNSLVAYRIDIQICHTLQDVPMCALLGVNSGIEQCFKMSLLIAVDEGCELQIFCKI
jgi:hypothetical protein